jgi:flagellar basal body P-ring formation protein FlgA
MQVVGACKNKSYKKMKGVFKMQINMLYKMLWLGILMLCASLLTHANTAMAAAANAAAGNPSNEMHAFSDIQKQIQQFLQTQSAGVPGQVSIEVGSIDKRVKLQTCQALETFFPAGSKAWGKTSVGVRCNAPSKWTIYVQAHIKIEADYWVAANPLAQGATINAQDLLLMHGDISALPSNIITHPNAAIGKLMTSSVAAGTILRQDILRAQTVVKQGQTVRLISAGKGFRITTEALAMADASDGQVVKAKTGNGNVVSGIAAKGGEVLVSF